MTSSELSAYTSKIASLLKEKKYLIRQRHIEKDRIWREISVEDVKVVLKNGRVTKVRHEDQTFFWRGKDIDDRLIELIGSLENQDQSDTLEIEKAKSFRVGSAYEADKNDEDVKKAWLKENPGYEVRNNKVQKKVKVEKIE